MKNKNIISEGWPAFLLTTAAEFITMGHVNNLESELTEAEFLEKFKMKYKKAIERSEELFMDAIEARLKSTDIDFFNLENLEEISRRNSSTPIFSSLAAEPIDPDNVSAIEESKKSLVDLIFENSIRYAVGGLGDHNKLVTSQVNFDWGKYKIPNPEDSNFENKLEIASANYFIIDGAKSLGATQFPGDPFTYEDLGGGQLKVISAPGSINPKTGDSYKTSIGKIFSIPQATEAETSSSEESSAESSHDTNADDHNNDIVARDIAALQRDKARDLKRRTLFRLSEGRESGVIPMLAWVALTERGGLNSFISTISHNIPKALYGENLVSRIPRQCQSMAGLTMIFLGLKIKESLKLSTKSFTRGADTLDYKLAIFKGRNVDRILTFIEYIEKIALGISSKLVAEFTPLANIDGAENVHNPGSMVADMLSDRDQCGYLMDPSGTADAPYGEMKGSLANNITRVIQNERDGLSKPPESLATENPEQYIEDWQEYISGLEDICRKKEEPEYEDLSEDEKMDIYDTCKELEQEKSSSGKMSYEDALRTAGYVQ